MKDVIYFIISLSIIIYIIARTTMFCCVKYNFNLSKKAIKYYAMIEAGSIVIAFILCCISLFTW